jgi:hypothetical protein
VTEQIYYLLDPVACQIKIGISIDVELRQRTLANERGTDLILLASHLGTVNDERRSHVACGAHRVAGEWFEDCPAVRAHIQSRVAHKAAESLREVRKLIDTLDDHGAGESADWHDDMTTAIREEMAEYLRLLSFCQCGQIGAMT